MAAPNKKRKNSKKKKGRSKAKKKGLNYPVMFGVLLVGALVYGGVYFKDRILPKEEVVTPKKVTMAWYKNHTEPVGMIRMPDAPLILSDTEAEIDTTIVEIKPKKPVTLEFKQKQAPRVAHVELAAKPKPPAPTIYEEALPQDVYTPKVIVPVKPKTVQKPEPVLAPTQAPRTTQPRWMKYALKVKPTPHKPMIALVIDDLGLDRKRTARTVALPGPMTMAFIPYSKNLRKQTSTARRAGHELLVHLPMEPINQKVDAGPNHLHTGLADEDLKERIHWNLERFEGYVGVNNHMGSLATANKKVMTALMEELRTREMLFLDSRTNASSVGAKIALQEGVPFAERNVFLDNVNEKDAVLKQLSLLEKVSLKTGYAVGIGHPRDGTIAALKEWLPLIESKGFTLVPISQIVLKNQGLS
ncbi:putative periplasmic protein [Candidatus Terasakiella magnetica]|uniref:Putative periplasmic protein n=1 Tax=Candidatus Terasakiella magnetica TaxID=1867952 RepID=A0A1C3RCQ1_9PROT|nr:divergent polysaccharide deacetylase family protein [Candidatus Terasakiella magnetica]SCA55050.1 putative periplasmic protein [Candidatus Terasakiella magnetica]